MRVDQPLLPFSAQDRMALIERPRSRHSDPDTSSAAARRARISQKDHCYAILRVLRFGGRAQLNAHEIAALTGGDNQITMVRLTQVQVARRMREMLEAGLVEVDGSRDGSRCYRICP